MPLRPREPKCCLNCTCSREESGSRLHLQLDTCKHHDEHARQLTETYTCPCCIRPQCASHQHLPCLRITVATFLQPNAPPSFHLTPAQVLPLGPSFCCSDAAVYFSFANGVASVVERLYVRQSQSTLLEWAWPAACLDRLCQRVACYTKGN